MQFDDALANSRFIVAQCRMRSGRVEKMIVLDLSIAGCMIDRANMNFTLDQEMLIKLPGLEYMRCTVTWIEQDTVGIQFEHLLNDAVLEHLLKAVRPIAA